MFASIGQHLGDNRLPETSANPEKPRPSGSSGESVKGLSGILQESVAEGLPGSTDPGIVVGKRQLL